MLTIELLSNQLGPMVKLLFLVFVSSPRRNSELQKLETAVAEDS